VFCWFLCLQLATFAPHLVSSYLTFLIATLACLIFLFYVILVYQIISLFLSSYDFSLSSF
jgi:hypothetical protein